MAFTVNDRAKVAAWFATMDIDQVQERFKIECGRDSPDTADIRKWHSTLMQTGSVRDEAAVVKRKRRRIDDIDHQFHSTDQLPEHILVMIFSNFEPKAICTRLAPICRRWRRLAYTKSVWRHKQIQFDIDADHPERMKSLAALLKKNVVQRLRVYSPMDLSRATMKTIFKCQLPTITDIMIDTETECTPSKLHILMHRMPNIRALDVNLQGSTEMMNLIAHPSTWPHLHTLSLPISTESLTDESVAVVMRSGKQFKSLTIYVKAPLTERCMRSIVEHQSRSLTHLTVSCELPNADLVILPLSNCPNLSYLNLLGKFTDISLGYLKLLHNLEHLHLYDNGDGNGCTVAGYRSLFDAENNGHLLKLKYLRLVHLSDFDDDCIDALTECCPNIEALGLFAIPITHASIIMIGQCLRRIRLLRVSDWTICEPLWAEIAIKQFTFSDSIQLADLTNYRRDPKMDNDEYTATFADHKRDLIVISEKGAISDWKSSKLSNRVKDIRKYDVGGCCI